MSKAFWTEEKVERAKALFIDGWSASQIARDIGAVSRNAVIGKLTRIGVYRQVPKPPGKTAGGGQKRSKGGYPFVHKRRHGGPRGGNTRAHRPPQVAAKTLKSAFRVRDGADLIGHEDLTRRDCQWPFGERLPFQFCGAKKDGDGPYCAEHAAMSTRAPTVAEARLVAGAQAKKKAGGARGERA